MAATEANKINAFLAIFGEEENIIPQSFIRDQKMVVFGYGSIFWKPEFKYESKKQGKIYGFQRAFWQGNITHRGTPDKVHSLFYFITSSEEVSNS